MTPSVYSLLTPVLPSPQAGNSCQLCPPPFSPPPTPSTPPHSPPPLHPPHSPPPTPPPPPISFLWPPEGLNCPSLFYFKLSSGFLLFRWYYVTLSLSLNLVSNVLFPFLLLFFFSSLLFENRLFYCHLVQFCNRAVFTSVVDSHCFFLCGSGTGSSILSH